MLETGCKREKAQYVCPQLISPDNHATFHSGDTVSILVYLPPPIQKDTAMVFIEISNGWYYGYDTLQLDTIIYPVFGNDHYSTIKMVLKAAGNGIDTDYIDTGIGSPGVGLICRGIAIYIQP